MKRLTTILTAVLLSISLSSSSVNDLAVLDGHTDFTRALVMQLNEVYKPTDAQIKAEKLAKKMWGEAWVYKHVMEDIKTMALELDIPYEWIVFIIESESGGDPAARNPKSKATGIIQWLPSTARDLGTSVRKLRKMTVREQLPWVKKYFLTQSKNFKFELADIESYVDLYLTVFHPKAVLKGDEYIISSKGKKAYRQNSIIDTDYGDNDGHLEVSDLKLFANRALS